MLRKTMIALFAVASVGMLAPSPASARAALAAAAVFTVAAVSTVAAASTAALVAVVSVRPPSEAAAASALRRLGQAAQSLWAALEFAAEPSQPMASAAVVSITGFATGGVLPWARLASD
jgi:hypothetical protein